MIEIYKQLTHIIENESYEELQNLKITKPEYFNWVHEIFEGIHVKERPNKAALIWTDGSETVYYTYQNLMDKCNQLLNFLREKGVKKDDIILTQLLLQPINWYATLATIKGGFCMIPTATIMGPNDLAFRFGKTLPKVVISDSDNAYKTDEAEEKLGIKIAVKIICDGHRPGWYSLQDIENMDTNADYETTKADDNLFMFFTSGTTGMPKIVCHTHFTHPVGHLSTTAWIGIKKDDIHYNISQPGWAKFAWSSFFAPWNVGATIFAYHTTQRFHAQTTLKLIEKHKVTTLCAPPTVLRLFIQEELCDFQFTLRECVAAGEPLNPEIIEEWKDSTGILIRDGFGQTESTCMIANLPQQSVKFGSMGKPTFLYDIVIANDDGYELGIEEEGNICVRMQQGAANGIFKGYLFDKEREAKVFRNGLYYTGDKAYKDADGYVWFIGRDDDVIKSSDYRIGPFEVESVLLEHDAVVESAVVASPHPIKGYEVKAFVVCNDQNLYTERFANELFAYCKSQLAPYKIPRIIEFVTELPKTISGKIRRIELRAEEAMNKQKGIIKTNEFYYKK